MGRASMSDEDHGVQVEDARNRRVEKAKKCAICVVCCPCNFTLECARELRDTAVYICLCPQRCVQERKRNKKLRQEKGVTRAEEIKKGLRDCVTPSPDCCGETHQDSCVFCYVSPKNWLALAIAFAFFYAYIALFFIALMLIYLAIGSYTPFNN